MGLELNMFCDIIEQLLLGKYELIDIQLHETIETFINFVVKYGSYFGFIKFSNIFFEYLYDLNKSYDLNSFTHKRTELNK